MAGGYLTFGSASQGLILNNYATSDPLALVARLGIGVSIIFSYPLNFLGLREGLLTMLKLHGSRRPPTGRDAAADGADERHLLFLKDLGLVVGLGGAVLGSALVYILPAFMAIFEKGGALSTKAEKLGNWAPPRSASSSPRSARHVPAVRAAREASTARPRYCNERIRPNASKPELS